MRGPETESLGLRNRWPLAVASESEANAAVHGHDRLRKSLCFDLAV